MSKGNRTKNGTTEVGGLTVRRGEDLSPQERNHGICVIVTSLLGRGQNCLSVEDTRKLGKIFTAAAKAMDEKTR
jgi:hypothetical protein